MKPTTTSLAQDCFSENDGKAPAHESVQSYKPLSSVPEYLQFLKKTDGVLTTADHKNIEVWELAIPEGNGCLSDWAARFRQHYCLDRDIDKLRDGTGLSRAQYLIELVFPDKSNAPGPGVRSGDFAELLIADYVEYLLGFWVPRGKYAEKAVRNESVKGVDILGFKVLEQGKASPGDTLLAFEVKAQLTNNKYDERLQVAVDDSSKDYLRSALTLNATKRRLYNNGDEVRAKIVQRFQNIADHPYIYNSGAAAVLSDKAYDEDGLEATKTAQHENKNRLSLIVVRGSGLMNLVHSLYERAASEA